MLGAYMQLRARPRFTRIIMSLYTFTNIFLAKNSLPKRYVYNLVCNFVTTNVRWQLTTRCQIRIASLARRSSSPLRDRYACTPTTRSHAGGTQPLRHPQLQPPGWQGDGPLHLRTTTEWCWLKSGKDSRVFSSYFLFVKDSAPTLPFFFDTFNSRGMDVWADKCQKDHATFNSTRTCLNGSS